MKTQVGSLWLSGTDQGIAEIDFSSRRKVSRGYPQKGLPSFLRKAGEGLRQYLDGRSRSPDSLAKIPLDLSQLSRFERRVLERCRRIPWGTCVTYRGLAEQVGNSKAARAVGQALARNPIPILIPCHRVIRSDGELGGYSGGQVWKRRLLAREGLQGLLRVRNEAGIIRAIKRR